MRQEIALLLAGIVGVGASFPALAHVVESDGSISAVLHVVPDDDPIIGEPSQLLFEFKDTGRKFTVPACDCTGKVLRAGREIYTAPLFYNESAPSRVNAFFSFAFPEKDIYQIQVTGTPREINAFQPFTLTYDMEVERGAADRARLGTHALHLIGISIVVIFVVGLFIFNYVRPA